MPEIASKHSATSKIGFCFALAIFMPAIAQSADIDKLNESGFSQLHSAAMQGNTKLAKDLIQSGADLEVQQGKFKGRPLQYAASNGRLEVAKILLESGAEVNSSDSLGRTPLMWAAQKGHAEVAKLLIENKADVDLATSKGWTALGYARQSNCEPLIDALMELEAKEFVKPSVVMPANHMTAPEPFVSRQLKDLSKSIRWDSARKSDLDIQVKISDSLIWDDEKLLLPVRIENKSDAKIRLQIHHEWDGGALPGSDVYARILSDHSSNAVFKPIYGGDGNTENKKSKLKPGKSLGLKLRLDSPGKGIAPGHSFLTRFQRGDMHVQVMLVFHKEEQVHFVVSPIAAIKNQQGSRPKRLDE